MFSVAGPYGVVRASSGRHRKVESEISFLVVVVSVFSQRPVALSEKTSPSGESRSRGDFWLISPAPLRAESADLNVNVIPPASWPNPKARKLNLGAYDGARVSAIN